MIHGGLQHARDPICHFDGWLAVAAFDLAPVSLRDVSAASRLRLAQLGPISGSPHWRLALGPHHGSQSIIIPFVVSIGFPFDMEKLRAVSTNRLADIGATNGIVLTGKDLADECCWIVS
jgi:hypothetical protein